MSEANERLRRCYDLLLCFEDYVRSGFAGPHIIPELKAVERGASRSALLEKIRADIARCTRCNLCHNRLKTVPGEGALDPIVMIIGEAPGADEDASGLPFVGAAGSYLTKWLTAVDVSREAQCFISNVVKCRPPENRDPRPEEMKACFPFLEAQIALAAPTAILALGRIASQLLLSEERGIGSLRGGSYFFKNIPVVPTYHPSAVLRDLSLRAFVWEDLKRLKALVEHVKVL
jgi:DNA polymerase